MDAASKHADPLAPLPDLPGVAAAVEEARDAIAAVHRHRANLRGWPVTSAEARLRGARASAGIEGASVAIPEDGEVADPVLAGALRLAARMEGEGHEVMVRTWRRSPLQALAALHMTAASGPGVDPDALGRPRADAGVAERLAVLAELVVGGTRVDAPVLAAVVHGELASLRPFGSMDGVVARAAARLAGCAAGVDPHDLGVPEVLWWRRVEEYRRALAGFAGGAPEGVGAWIRLHCEGLVDGAREARSIADAAV